LPLIPGNQITLLIPRQRFSSASQAALEIPGFRLSLSTQLSVIIAVPSPSTSMPPPSRVRDDTFLSMLILFSIWVATVLSLSLFHKSKNDQLIAYF